MMTEVKGLSINSVFHFFSFIDCIGSFDSTFF